MIIDTHAHLASTTLQSDLNEVIRRAVDSGVERIVCIGTRMQDAARVVEICEQFPQVYGTVGIHPCDADSVKDATFIESLAQFAQHPKIVGIGEIGLDFYHPAPVGFNEITWRQKQAEVLELQLALAAELKLNVVLHSRNSFAELREQVLPWSDQLRGVFHCFTGNHTEALSVIDHGHLVSFTGIVTFKNTIEVQECVSQLPLGQFMLETDCPYLAPTPHRGKRNEPAFVRLTAERVAQLRGCCLETIAEATSKAAFDFFKGLK